MHPLIKAVLLIVFVAVAGYGQAESGAKEPVRLGFESAATTIEVFIDLQCPSCAAFYPKLREVEMKNSFGVSVIFRHRPLSIHDKSMIAAQAVEAARKQGKGIEMLQMILENQRAWANSSKTKTFKAYARKLGLDEVKYDEDFHSEEIAERISSDLARARSLNINAVPTTYLNGRQLTFDEAQDIENLVLQGI